MAEGGCAVVLVTHDLDLLTTCATSCLVIDDEVTVVAPRDAAAVGVYVLQSTYAPGLWRPAEMLLGAGVIFAVQLLWVAGSAWAARRSGQS